MLIDTLKAKNAKLANYETKLVNERAELHNRIQSEYGEQIKDCLEVCEFCHRNSIDTSAVIATDSVGIAIFPAVMLQFQYFNNRPSITVHDQGSVTAGPFNATLYENDEWYFGDHKEHTIRNLEAQVELLRDFYKYFPAFYKKTDKFVRKVKIQEVPVKGCV